MRPLLFVVTIQWNVILSNLYLRKYLYLLHEASLNIFSKAVIDALQLKKWTKIYKSIFFKTA